MQLPVRFGPQGKHGVRVEAKAGKANTGTPKRASASRRALGAAMGTALLAVGVVVSLPLAIVVGAGGLVALGVASATNAARRVFAKKRQHISLKTWQQLEAVPIGSAEFDRIVNHVAISAQKTESVYNRRLHVLAVYRVRNEELEARFAQSVSEIPSAGGLSGMLESLMPSAANARPAVGAGSHRRSANVQQLFHGTSMRNARAITRSGFKLGRRGMFGKGCYFAQSPLKSWNYSVSFGQGAGILLLCDVALGRSLKAKHPAGKLEPGAPELRRGSFLNRRAYSSVHAPAGKAVRVDEFCIYDPALALPRYVIHCTNERAPRAGS